MPKKIALFIRHAYWGEYLSQLLHGIFPGELEIINYSFDKNPIREPIQADLALITEPILYYVAQRYLDAVPYIVDIEYTFQKEQYELLRVLPAGSRVLIICDSDHTLLSTVSEFRAIGLTHLEFVPFMKDPMIDSNYPATAVTLGPNPNPDLPDFIETEILVGRRVIDLFCLTQMAIYLNLEYMMKQESFVRYAASLCPKCSALSSILDRSHALDQLSFDLLGRMGEGVLLADHFGLIQDCSAAAAALLGGQETLLGQPIASVLPCQLTRTLKRLEQESAPQILTANGTTLSLQLFPIHARGIFSGSLAVISSFQEKEKRQRSLRRQILKKGSAARHTFRDILTENAEMMALKAAAEKHAKSSATILITGESGTGKEVLAQSIHNASPRRDRPFVAINCSALPRELLGSELFGYEEGAFTGARKGGKSGLFELADSGTIFLDEIGDMALELQAQILRVLEEREVLRIGGETACPVNIRVIAATNQDLWALIEQGRFRRDLYYRLNVIPLELPPLRQRGGDVLVLLKRFKASLGCSFTLSREAENYLLCYPWYGNVRELRNWVEYLAALAPEHLELYDVERLLHRRQLSEPLSASGRPVPLDLPKEPNASNAAVPESPACLDAFWLEIVGDELQYYLVMRSLARHHSQGVSLRTLAEDARQAGHPLSEVSIRRIIQTLCRNQLAFQGRGRVGSRITTLGIAAFELLQKNSWLQRALRNLDS